jgi:hypothetical protein
MNTLDAELTLRALQRTGDSLAASGLAAPIRLIVAGGVAGMLAGLLEPSRTTGDCDVMWASDESQWAGVVTAAAEAGERLGLPQHWLNRDCAMYAWCLPLGWLDRCKRVGTFGSITVDRLSRLDLIATKVIGSPKRPQDFADLRAMSPTAAELAFIDDHLDRLAAEHLGGDTFDDQCAIVEALRTKQ